jgi:hypothetical protein
MKKIILNSLALAICMIFVIGCSSVKPTQKQSSVAVAPFDQNQPCVVHNSVMGRFVRDWLKGDAPPPDVTEEDKTGIAAGCGVAYKASMVGLLIAQIAHK